MSYNDLFFEFVPENTKWGDWCPPGQVYFRGESSMPGAHFYAGYRLYTAPVQLEREPHFHREEEYLVFIGGDLLHPFESFDAEIEFFIGEDINNMERRLITQPTIIRVPPCIWHCPMDFRRVDKPVFFQAALMNGRFGSVKQHTGENGEISYVYQGDGHRPCVLNSAKQCDFCGSCFSSQNKEE